MILILIILATFVIGLISLLGLVFIYRKKVKPPFLKSIISLAAGSLLAVTLLDLLPEAVEKSQLGVRVIFSVTLLGILFFFLFEGLMHWHHCRCEENDRMHHQDKKYLAYFNLTGDAIHNTLDGFLVASAFMLDFKTGLIVTLAVIIHEIPQEISDFGILLYAGVEKVRALFFNFLVALSAIGGAVLFYFFGKAFEIFIPLMAAFAAGNFIYLATADLIPELHHERDPQKVLHHAAWLIIGVVAIYFFGIILGE